MFGRGGWHLENRCARLYEKQVGVEQKQMHALLYQRCVRIEVEIRKLSHLYSMSGAVVKADAASKEVSIMIERLLLAVPLPAVKVRSSRECLTGPLSNFSRTSDEKRILMPH